MYVRKPYLNNSYRDVRDGRLLLISLLSFATAGVVVLTSAVVLEPEGVLGRQSVLAPLCLGLGIVLLSPSVYLLLRHRFDFFHPLVYPVFTYMLPAFVFGGLYLQFGSNPSWVLSLIPNPDYYLPLSVLYIMIGFIGLMIGFVIPAAGNLGKALSRRLPTWDWKPSALRGPCVVLVLTGLAINVFSYSIGVGGYQMLETPSVIGGLLNTLGTLSGIGSFLLWHAFFRREQTKQAGWNVIVALLIAQILLFALIGGSRFSLVGSVLAIFAAYRFSGRHLKPHAMWRFAVVGIIGLFIGINIGTTFRNLKGSEAPIGFVENFRIGLQSATLVLTRSPADNWVMFTDVLFSRIETLSSFAVIVASYKQLRPIEEEFGIANNIWTYTWTAFIPRFIWPEKPKISDARTIGAIYYNMPENSFGFTIFGDLLRNFGPIGVPIGMILLGFILRVLYVSLVKIRSGSAWRSASYFFLLANVNIENFYGAILPRWIHLAIVLLVSGIVINTFVANRRHQKGNTYIELTGTIDYGK